MKSPQGRGPVRGPAHRPDLVFFGDPHGDFRPVLEVVDQLRPRAIVLLGDLQPRQPLHLDLASIRSLTDIWFIHGNHDTDSERDYDNVWGSDLADRNLDGRVVEISGHRVAGLGGIFREKVWNPELGIGGALFDSPAEMLRAARARRFVDPHSTWRDGIPLRHRSTIFPDVYSRLLEQRAEVLVSHEAPGAHRHGFAVLGELADAMGVEVHVHGHHHQNIDYQSAGLLPAKGKPRVFGVDKGSYLTWSPGGDNHAVLGPNNG